MKKRFTLLSVLTIASSLTFAQNLPTLSSMKMNPSKITVNPSTGASDEITAKAGGDIMWSNDFATASDWTFGNVAPGTQGTWVIGAYPAQMNDYMGAMNTAMTAPLASFNGVQYLLGSAPIVEQNAFMVSGTIDLSAAALATISFDQSYRAFNHDNTIVDFSTDNGATWNSIPVNTSAATNAPTTKNRLYIDVNTASSATCKLRFRWESLTASNDFGAGYGWAIDNVEITEGYDNNVSLLNLYAVVGDQEISYKKMPTVQAAAAGNMSFGARVKNTGAVAQDIVLNMTATGFTQASAAETVAPLAIDSLEVPMANGYTITNAIGSTVFTGTLSTGTVLDFTADDSKMTTFEVTNKLYAVDSYDGTPASITSSFTGWQNGTGDAEIGTYFEIFANQSLGAIQIGIANVTAANQGLYVGKSIQGKIYELQSGALVQIDASLEATITPASFGNIVYAYMINPLALEAGKTYVATASLSEGAEVPIAMAGSTIGGLVTGFDGGTGVNLRATDSTANTVTVPVVRLDFNDYTGVNEIAAQFDLNVYPNPFSSNTEVAFELKNDANVSVNVTDITGRTVATVDSQMYTSGAHTVSINGTNLNAGVYNCTITIGNNVITKRIVKK